MVTEAGLTQNGVNSPRLLTRAAALGKQAFATGLSDDMAPSQFQRGQSDCAIDGRKE